MNLLSVGAIIYIRSFDNKTHLTEAVMPEITRKQFLKMLDKKHPGYVVIRDYVRGCGDSGVLFAEKGPDLVQVIHHFIECGRFCLVDKKLGVVFGVREESCIDVALFVYHKKGELSQEEFEERFSKDGLNKNVDEWVIEGYGYYVDPDSPDMVVVSSRYEPDDSDAEIFSLHKLQLV